MTTAKLFNIIKSLLIISILAALYTAIGFGLPLLQSFIPGAADGLAAPASLLQLFFGDSGWTREGYFIMFSRALWIAFFMLVVYIVTAALQDTIRKGINNHE